MGLLNGQLIKGVAAEFEEDLKAINMKGVNIRTKCLSFRREDVVLEYAIVVNTISSGRPGDKIKIIREEGV